MSIFDEVKKETNKKKTKKEVRGKMKLSLESIFLPILKRIRAVSFKTNLPKISLKPKNLMTSLLISLAIILGLAGIGYGAIYYQTSKTIEDAKRLTETENYEEAINELNLAQVSWVVEKLAVNKQKIYDEIDKNKKLSEDESQYNQGVDELNSGNFQKAVDLLLELPEDSFYYQSAQLKIEESKRMMVEGELASVTVAKDIAEQKARREEISRKAKEQELAAKEAKEQELAQDKDNDGLTYREEINLGTLDNDSDTDDDGIIDGLDSHPAGGGRSIAQHFEWYYHDEPWKWDYSFSSDWYDYYKNKEHGDHSASYVTSEDKYIKEIADMLKTASEKNNYSGSLFATAFIQSLGYVGDDVIGYNDYPKYPLETLAEQNGDCEDTSYLAAAIIEAMGIDSVLVELPGHMAIAIAFSGEPSGYYYKMNNGWRYYYIETTGDGWQLGDLPEDSYKYKAATLVKLPSNEKEIVFPSYENPCYSSSDFSGYYYDGKNYYSNNTCTNLITCLSYSGYYYHPQTEKFYHDSGCTQILVKGCYKSKSYSGKFYTSGSSWYYDSQCTQTYKSMSCSYPSSYSYSCTSEYSYSSKKSTCDYYASSRYLSSMASSCYQELEECRSDINEYQAKLNEYNQCYARKEY
ncbi:MAG: hypothetical protein ABID67_00100 [Candidatus Nealsonbacteria bacterium]